jgi:MFS superfamily sulfate permease-like transporter
MTKNYLSKDLPASLVVFLVALPLCMGVAMASGGNIVQGIMAGVIGGIVVGLISGSHVSVSGPAAGLITIVIASVSDLKVLSPQHYLGAFALVVFLAGLIQLLMGVLKLGVIADFIPVSVIKGMLAAIGIIMILKQIPHLIGYDKDAMGEEEFLQNDGHNTFSELFFSFEQIGLLAVCIGVIGLAIHFIWETKWIKKNRVFSMIPASLLTVLMGILINTLALRFLPNFAVKSEHMVSVPIFSESGNLKESVVGLFHSFSFPDFHFIGSSIVWKSAVIIAVVASIESLLSIEAGDKIDPEKRTTPTNRELFAQGIGNVIAGLVGALPITAVIVRTSANVNAGSKSKLSAIFHGFWLLLFVLIAPHLINKIPLSALAAVLIFVGYKLAKPSLFFEQKSKGNNAFYPFLITLVAILFTDLLIGISIGLLVGFYFVIKSNFHKSFSVVSEGNNNLIRFHHQATFLNKSVLKSKLIKINSGDSVILDFSNCTFMDSDIIDILNDFMIHATLSQIHVEMLYASESQEKSILKRLTIPQENGR